MRQAFYSQPRLTPAVKYLLITIVASFLVQLTLSALQFPFVDYFGFSSSTFFLKGRLWQIVTYSFLHGSIFHILFNCMGLYMLGPELENRWGTQKFAMFYGLCAIGGGVFQSVVWGVAKLFAPETAALVGAEFIIGASGALYGLFVAFGRLYGDAQILVMMIFPLKAKYFVMILTAIEIISAIFFNNAGVAHLVHLGGLVTGFGLLFFKGPALNGRGGYSFLRKKTLDRDEVKRRLNLIVNRRDGDDDDNPPAGDKKKYPITWN